jgi:urease accessory protein
MLNAGFLIIVERVSRESELPETVRDYARDTVTLGWADRTHVHGRRRTDGGLEFGTSLPRGTVLRSGDCFIVDQSRLVISIVERPEPVFVIEPGSAPEWALFAYHIGNRHHPVMITERSLVCPDVPGVEPLLQQHRVPYARATLPFTPAATVVGHQH